MDTTPEPDYYDDEGVPAWHLPAWLGGEIKVDDLGSHRLVGVIVGGHRTGYPASGLRAAARALNAAADEVDRVVASRTAGGAS